MSAGDPRVGLQLFTVREEMAADFDATIARVAEIGYAGVEVAAIPQSVTPERAADVIQAAGMELFSAHSPLPTGGAAADAIEVAHRLGVERIVWSGVKIGSAHEGGQLSIEPDPRFRSAEGLVRLIEELNEAASAAAAAGLSLGVHTHWWEMDAVAGEPAYRVLARELDPSIFFELDAYWAMTAGVDPASLIAELDGRSPIVHIKDGPFQDRRGRWEIFGDDPLLQPLGQGVLDIPGVVRAAHRADWLAVELDNCETDIMDAIATSHAYLTGMTADQR